MKILMIRLSSLGDIVLTEPVVRTLNKLYPQAEIHYLVKHQFEEVVKSFPVPVQIVEWNNDISSLLKIRRNYYDMVVDLHNKPNTTLIRFFTKASPKLVYNKQRRLREQIVKGKTKAEVSSTLDLYYSVFPEDIKVKFPYPQLKCSQDELSIRQKFNLSSRKYCLLFPGATSYTKRWLPENYRILAEKLSSTCRIILCGSKSEFSLCNDIAGKNDFKILNLAGKTTLKELIALISAAEGVIANDSGPAHLAAALNIPLVTIFGGTSPRLGFAPLGQKVQIITKNLFCSPCSLHGRENCPLKHFRCMREITPEEVLRVFYKLTI